MPVNKMEVSAAVKHINDNITCQKWASIFKQNLEDRGGSATWKFNVDALHANM